MRKSRYWILLAVVAALAFVAVGCGGDDDDDTTADTGAAPADTGDGGTVDCTASIGIMGPFTGDVAAIGQEQLNWAKFAVDQFNTERGTTFELVEGDTQLDPAQAATVAPQFVSNSDIAAVVGPAGSQEVEAVGQIYGDAGIAFISPSATATNLTTDYETFFRVVPTDADQGPTDATYMVETLGAQNVLIIDDQSSYSTGLADSTTEALEAGGATVSRESVSQDQTDFSGLVSAVADDTDVVFLPWQVAANAQLFGNQLEEQGKDVVIFGSDGLFSPDDFSIAGAYVSSFAPDITGLDDPAIQELVSAFGPSTATSARSGLRPTRRRQSSWRLRRRSARAAASRPARPSSSRWGRRTCPSPSSASRSRSRRTATSRMRRSSSSRCRTTGATSSSSK
jgi:branched-chain amino acid transport system substrate-binding protein